MAIEIVVVGVMIVTVAVWLMSVWILFLLTKTSKHEVRGHSEEAGAAGDCEKRHEFQIGNRGG